MKRNFAAILYLTLGYWIFSFLLHFGFAILAHAGSGGGIEVETQGGVLVVRFEGHPGDVIFIANVLTGGPKKLSFEGMPNSYSGSSTNFQGGNNFIEIAIPLVFAIISLPILRKLLTRPENRNTRQTTRSGDHKLK